MPPKQRQQQTQDEDVFEGPALHVVVEILQARDVLVRWLGVFTVPVEAFIAVLRVFSAYFMAEALAVFAFVGLPFH